MLRLPFLVRGAAKSSERQVLTGVNVVGLVEVAVHLNSFFKAAFLRLESADPDLR